MAARLKALERKNRELRQSIRTLWLSEFTYVATWAGLVYVALEIDAYARRIVGWWVSRTAHVGFVLDALEWALHNRGPFSPAGSSITAVVAASRSRSNTPGARRRRYKAFGRQPWRQLRQCPGRDHQRTLQGRGHSSTRAMAVVRSRRVCQLEWVDWFKNRRLMEPICNIPPAEVEECYYAMLNEHKLAA